MGVEELCGSAFSRSPNKVGVVNKSVGLLPPPPLAAVGLLLLLTVEAMASFDDDAVFKAGSCMLVLDKTGATLLIGFCCNTFPASMVLVSLALDG